MCRKTSRISPDGKRIRGYLSFSKPNPKIGTSHKNIPPNIIKVSGGNGRFT